MRGSLKGQLKDLLYAASWLAAGRTHDRTRVILLYHSIGSHHPRSVSRSDFARQIAYLRERFRVVPLRELPQALAQAEPRTALAWLSFDDAYLDNYEQALLSSKAMA